MEDEGDTNCYVGEGCGNRFTPTGGLESELVVFRTKDRGLGLKTKVDLEGGNQIIQYVGEVVDVRMYIIRLADQALRGNIYMMELGDNKWLDAKSFGNKSRLVNHSCQPNCYMQKWDVDGYVVVILTSSQSIKCGAELLYDYNFGFGREIDDQRWQCRCRASSYRGTMLPQSQDDASQADSSTGRHIQYGAESTLCHAYGTKWLDDASICAFLRLLSNFESEDALNPERVNVCDSLLFNQGCQYEFKIPARPRSWIIVPVHMDKSHWCVMLYEVCRGLGLLLHLSTTL